MELDDLVAILRQLVAIDIHLMRITDNLHIMLRQQVVLIDNQQAMNRAILRLLENVTGQSSNEQREL